MENNYYIYFHINLESEEIFYVGKGKDKRAWSKAKRSQHWNNVVNKYGYKVEIIHQNLSEYNAFEIEKSYIKILGREDLGEGYLVNHTDGGEGTSGKEAWNKGKKCEYIDKLLGRKNMLGKKHTELSINKIKNSNKGKNPNKISVIYKNKIYDSLDELNRIEFNNLPKTTFHRWIDKHKIIIQII